MLDSKRLLDRFLRYIACDSESGDEERFCRLIMEELEGLGLTVTRDNAGEACGSNGWNVYASLPGDGEPILFCSHMDTVKPGKNIRPIIGEDGIVRSSGDTILGADDKCGISAVMEALAMIREGKLAHRPIEVLFTISEETGLHGSRNADYSRLSSKQAIVFDSGRVDYLLNQAPAHIVLHVRVEGKSAHAGVAPEQGVHALKAAALAVAEITCGRADELTVMNVSNFLSPGKTNVVPAEATFDMEIRCFDEERLAYWIETVKQIIEKACAQVGASCTVEMERHNTALHVPEDSPLMVRICEACRKLGMEPAAKRAFGGSDAAWLFANGIHAVNVGAGMGNVHSVDETLTIEYLEQAVHLILDMVSPE